MVDEPATDAEGSRELALNRFGPLAGHGICVVGSGSASTFDGNVMLAEIAQMMVGGNKIRSLV